MADNKFVFLGAGEVDSRDGVITVYLDSAK